MHPTLNGVTIGIAVANVDEAADRYRSLLARSTPSNPSQACSSCDSATTRGCSSTTRAASSTAEAERYVDPARVRASKVAHEFLERCRPPERVVTEHLEDCFGLRAQPRRRELRGVLRAPRGRV